MDPFADAVCYLVFVGGFQAALIIVVALIFCIVKLFYRKFAILKSLASYALFNLWLLGFGIIGNCIWYGVAPGWLYVNHDPVVEWIPFIVPGDWTLDIVCHGSLTPGTKWIHMYLCWFCIALPVWVLTIVFYRLTKKSRPVRNPTALGAGLVFVVSSVVILTLVFYLYKWGFTTS